MTRSIRSFSIGDPQSGLIYKRAGAVRGSYVPAGGRVPINSSQRERGTTSTLSLRPQSTANSNRHLLLTCLKLFSIFHSGVNKICYAVFVELTIVFGVLITVCLF